jgi:hypothetical protein
MVTLLANTFKSQYYEHLMGNSVQHFYDAVIIAERIEQGIKTSRISKRIEKNEFIGKKKDAEVGNVEEGCKSKKNYQNQNYQTLMMQPYYLIVLPIFS